MTANQVLNNWALIISYRNGFESCWSVTRPRGYKTSFKLSSVEPEISTADKC